MNLFNIDIRKGEYYKTHETGKDESTGSSIQEIDTESGKRTYYEVTLFKRYYYIDKRDELMRQIIQDMKDLTECLEASCYLEDRDRGKGTRDDK